MSSKGKTPWIVYNRQTLADSQFCIEFLKQEQHVDTDKHLTRQEKAMARALRELTEENLYWYFLFLSQKGKLLTKMHIVLSSLVMQWKFKSVPLLSDYCCFFFILLIMFTFHIVLCSASALFIFLQSTGLCMHYLCDISLNLSSWLLLSLNIFFLLALTHNSSL